MRVPAAIRWPGRIPPARVSSEIVSELDIFPTLVSLAGGRIARDHPSDGVDLTSFLTAGQPSPRHDLYYIVNRDLQAVREGAWKLRIADGTAPALFDLDRDPGERLDVASANPGVVAHLRELLERSSRSCRRGRRHRRDDGLETRRICVPLRSNGGLTLV